MKNATIVDNVEVLNCTPHPITFQKQSGELVNVPTSGMTLKAAPVEQEINVWPDATKQGIQQVTTVFKPSPDARDEYLAVVNWANSDEATVPRVVVGSIISAQAYGPAICSLVPVPGFERVPPAEKRFRADKFNVFPK